MTSEKALAADGCVVIVGASLAGLRAAEALRTEGFSGRVVLIGDEPPRPYDRPPLSKQVLMGKWAPEKTELAGEARLAELGLELALGQRAVGFDAERLRVDLEDGSSVEGDGVIVATGARVRHLPGTEGDPGVLTLRTLDDAVTLRAAILAAGPEARVVVVGAGFIGAEVASACADLASEVTVIEATDVPLAPILGEEVGAACAALHATKGVALRTGVGVERLVAPKDGKPGEVVLADGTVLAADMIVVGIGVLPNLAWLDDSGLLLGDGVECDEALFAADGVVAAGDVARWRWRHGPFDERVRIEHWQIAADSGAAAAHSLLAGRAAAEPFNPVPYFWSDQYGVKLQVLGHPGPDDDMVEVVEGSLESQRFVALYGRAGRLSAVVAMSRPRQLMAYRPLLVAEASWDEARAVDLA